MGPICDCLVGKRRVVCLPAAVGAFEAHLRPSHRLDRHVALKILTEQVGTGEHRMDEVPILQKINQSDDTHPGKAHILRMLDHFTHRGPNGLHSCLTFDVHGSTVLSLQKMLPKHVLPIDLVKRISGQMLLALDFVHRSCEIVHTGSFLSHFL